MEYLGWTIDLGIGPSTCQVLSDFARDAQLGADIIAQSHYLKIQQSGDDCIALIYHGGSWFCLENDFSSFDQTETNVHVHERMLQFFHTLMDPDVIAKWYSNFGGRWGKTVKLIVKLMMGSGNPMTTLWNSVWGILFIVWAITMAGTKKNGDFDTGCIAKADEHWGMISKPKWTTGSTAYEALKGCTFLKGWWVPLFDAPGIQGGGLAWCPLPSRLLKMFKMDIHGDYSVLRRKAKDEPTVLERRGYEHCLGLRYYHLCPLLDEITESYTNAFEERFPKRAPKLREIFDLSVAAGRAPVKEFWVEKREDEDHWTFCPLQYRELIRERYSVDFSDLYGVLTPHYENTDPVSLSHPSVAALGRVDYA